MCFGKRLRDLRVHRGLSQEELGKILSLDKSTISLYESGKREPAQDTLQQIADYKSAVDTLTRWGGTNHTALYLRLHCSSSVFVGLRVRDLSDGLATVLRCGQNKKGSLPRRPVATGSDT